MPLWGFYPIFQGDILLQRVHFNFSLKMKTNKKQYLLLYTYIHISPINK